MSARDQHDADLGRDNGKTIAPEPQPCLSGESSAGRSSRRDDAVGACATVRCSSQPDFNVAGKLLKGASDVFGDGEKSAPAAPTVDVKMPHAKIG
jgi:hypothetical protein